MRKRDDSFANPFSSLKNPTYRMYWIGICFSSFGIWIQNTAQPWLAYSMTDSPMLLGVVSAVQFAPMFLFSAFAGVLIDRLPKKMLLLLTQCGFLLISGLMAFLMFTDRVSYGIVLLIACLTGVVNVINLPLRQAWISSLVEKRRLVNAVGLYASAFNMARILGPAMAGLIMEHIGLPWCYLANVGLFALALLSLIPVRPGTQEVARAATMADIWTDLKSGVAHAADREEIRSVLLIMAITGIFSSNFSVLLPVLSVEVLGRGELGYGMLMSMMGAGSFLGAFIVAFYSGQGPQRVFLRLSPILLAFIWIIVAFCDGLVVYAALIVGGFFYVSYSSTASAALQSWSEPEYVGRIMSLFTLMQTGTSPLGNLYSGKLSDCFGVRIGSAICGISALLFIVTIVIISGHAKKVTEYRGNTTMDYAKESLRLHEQWGGKIEVVATVPTDSKDALSLAYTPGVAQPCLEIKKDISKSYTLTRRHNLCAVITDGSAVLGLGDIGPEAGMPVMEGKCVLFKAFGGVDAFPLCVNTRNVDEFVETVYYISGSFGGINLEDIAAPRCFEIERKLKELCDIPVFHDDQHGTAVITLAGLTNALKVVGKKKQEVKIITSGAGAAAIAITKLLLSAGFQDITMCDRSGAIHAGREGLNWIKEEMAQVTNLEKKSGTLADMLVGADVFIGVSAPGAVTTEMVQKMATDAIVFACANPTPEIFPEEAKAGGAAVVATGRSDYPNQINNVLAFPGIFRGTFDVRASTINEEMKVAAAQALADLIGRDELTADYIIPAAFDSRVGPAVAAAVAAAACRTGVARIPESRHNR